MKDATLESVRDDVHGDDSAQSLMLADQRRQLILGELERDGMVRVSQLTRSLGVSDMTIRRDLQRLAAHGWLQKVHGGAVAAHSSAHEPAFEAKQNLAQPAKRAIAQAALRYVLPDTSIGISAGSTTSMLAGLIRSAGLRVSVVTNSTTVADALHTGSADNASVVLTGGATTPSAALVGPLADRAISGLHVDRLFLGVHGMDPRAGYTTPNLSEAQTNRIFIERARQVVVLADSSKFGTVGLADFGPLALADVLITDDALTPAARQVLGEHVTELIVVPASHPDSEPRTADRSAWTADART